MRRPFLLARLVTWQEKEEVYTRRLEYQPFEYNSSLFKGSLLFTRCFISVKSKLYRPIEIDLSLNLFENFYDTTHKVST